MGGIGWGQGDAFVGGDRRCRLVGTLVPPLVVLAFGLGAAPAVGEEAYVTNFDSDNVSVIDTATNTVTDTVSVGERPFAVAITPDTASAYVTNFDSDNVSVIDTATNTVTDTVAVRDGPFFVAITPDGAFAYVANRASDKVSVIDTATNEVTDTVAVDDGPAGIAITPDGRFAYVANQRSHTVSVINTATNAVIGTVRVRTGREPTGPFGVAITPDGGFVYVTNQFTNNVSVIRTATNRVAANVAVRTAPFGVSITPDGGFAYVTNQFSDDVSVIDTATRKVSDTVVVGREPAGSAITPTGDFAYIANYASENVSVIDTATNAVIDTVAVGDGPTGVAITPESGPPRCSTPGGPGAGYAAGVLGDGPALYWRLGEATGTSAADTSGNGNSGTYAGAALLGAPGAIAGDSNTAVDLGAAASGRVESSYGPFSAGSVRSYEGWACREAPRGFDVLFSGSRTNASPALYTAEASPRRVNFDVRSGAGGAAIRWQDALPPDGAYFHWVLVFDDAADQAELYINGVSQGIQTGSEPYHRFAQRFWAGNYASKTVDDAWPGPLDEIAVYERALSPIEVCEHYAAGSGAGVASCLGP